MFQIEVHRKIHQIFEFLYRVGFWSRQDKETVREWLLKLFYSIYFFLFPLWLAVGAASNDNKNEKIFSVQVALMITVVLVKFLHLIWRKTELLELLNRICDYCVDDRDGFNLVNDKSNILMKFSTVFMSLAIFTAIATSLVAPFMGAERKLFFQFWFPLDWTKSDFAFWTTFLFIFTEVTFSSISLLFSVIMWYLMAQCSSRYEVLGRQIKEMGETKINEPARKKRISDTEKENFYRRDLVRAMTSHSHLKELTDQLDSFLSQVFVFQLVTSGLCICASIYSIAFIRGDNFLELLCYLIGLVYNIFDIFMIMFFGNEIELSSGKLSYNLYESNWVDRSQSTKKDILIFGEFLRQPQRLMILKIYPLTLETFSRILNSAYSMFNILKSFE